MACYDEAVSYAKNRVMFGRPIGGFQIQHGDVFPAVVVVRDGEGDLRAVR